MLRCGLLLACTLHVACGTHSTFDSAEIAWHGIRTSLNAVEETAVPLLELDVNPREASIAQCGKSSVHILAVNSERLIVVGCFRPCESSTYCGLAPPTGMIFASVNAGAQWALARRDEPLLLRTGTSAVTVPSIDALHARVFCLVGGYGLPPVEGSIANATDVVVCSVDGLTWVKQAEGLPTPRGRASAVSYVLPGEMYPRIFLLGGFARELTISLASDPRDTPIPTAQWMVMSEQVVGPAAGQPLGAEAVRGWTAISSAVPSVFEGRVLPSVTYWPGAQWAGSRQGLMIGQGFDTRDNTNTLDWWHVEDPRNASSWRKLPSSAFTSLSLGQTDRAYPLAVFKGNFSDPLHQHVPVELQEDYIALYAFISDRRAIRFDPTDERWSLVDNECATLKDKARDTEEIECISYDRAVTSAVVVQDKYNKPVLVAMATVSVVRGFLYAGDYSCPPGQYAQRGGLTPGEPICATCTVCTGYTGSDFDTTSAGRCSASSWREGNDDSTCRLCRVCPAENGTVARCTPTKDTVCGLRAQKGPYIPSSPLVQDIHAQAVTAVGVVAATACVAACAFHCASSSGGGPQQAVVQQSRSRMPAERRSGEGTAAGSDKLDGARRHASAVHNPIHMSGNGLLQEAQSEVHSSDSAFRRYAAAHQRTTGREIMRRSVFAAASAILHMADIALVVCSQMSVAAFALSLLSPPDALRSVGWTKVQLSNYQLFGKLLLSLLAANALLVAGWLLYIACKQRLSLSSADGGALSQWANEGFRRPILVALLVLLPMHSRLVALLMPGSPLRFPAPRRLQALLAVASPVSILVCDVPVLAVVCEALAWSGYPVDAWTGPGSLTAGVPQVARAALTLAGTSLVVSLARLLWDITACVQSGGLYRLRRALLALPEWQWLLGLVLPTFAGPQAVAAEVVPRVVIAATSDGILD